MTSVLVRNATVLTMNDGMEVVNGAVSVRDGRIAAIGPESPIPHDLVIDATDHYLLPGFVQTHIHLCQTLFRGYADDLRLIEWLRTRIWPMEAAHTRSSLGASARLASLELLRSGTTSILTIETVHGTDAVIEATAATGIRATIGKSLMDHTTPDAPDGLHEDGQQALAESVALFRQSPPLIRSAAARDLELTFDDGPARPERSLGWRRPQLRRAKHPPRCFRFPADSVQHHRALPRDGRHRPDDAPRAHARVAPGLPAHRSYRCAIG